jgi:oxygen-independent coproporphyrinogen-3 oxidase
VDIGMDQYALPGDPLALALAAGQLSRTFMGFTASRTDALVGLGVSAIGDTRAAYAQNEKNLQRYEVRIAAGELPLQRGHVLSDEDRQIRAMLWELFAGRAATPTDAALGSAWWSHARQALEPLREDGLVEITGDRVSITPAGRPFLRRIGLAFDQYLARAAGAPRSASA